MAISIRSLSLQVASAMFNIPIPTLRQMIPSRICFKDDGTDTILCDYETKKYTPKMAPQKLPEEKSEAGDFVS